MSRAAATARRMLERTCSHPVISLFMDLDPARFATAPARATQLRSLLDEAGRDDVALGHADRAALTEDLRRLQGYLASGVAPVSGARSLAVFCSGRDDLFETVALGDPVAPRVVIARAPYVEPLVVEPLPDRWCVTLVSRRSGAILAGELSQVSERERVTDEVHGQHSQGGWSQANYERSVENEAEQHLRRLADALYRTWQRAPFARLVLGGPHEDLDRFSQLLHNDLRPTLSPQRLGLDAQTATVAEVRAALQPVLAHERAATRESVLRELRERLAGGGAAVAGVTDTLRALGERRVQRLVLDLNFTAPGGRCPACGLVEPAGAGACPADGTELAPVGDLRATAVECAVLQDAEVTVVGEGGELPPVPMQAGEGIAALLRF